MWSKSELQGWIRCLHPKAIKGNYPTKFQYEFASDDGNDVIDRKYVTQTRWSGLDLAQGIGRFKSVFTDQKKS